MSDYFLSRGLFPAFTRLACLALLVMLVSGYQFSAQAAAFSSPSPEYTAVIKGQPAALPEISPAAAARSHIPSHIPRAGYLLAGALIIQAAIIAYASVRRRRK